MHHNNKTNITTAGLHRAYNFSFMRMIKRNIICDITHELYIPTSATNCHSFLDSPLTWGITYFMSDLF